jgi:hypothetical protein
VGTAHGRGLVGGVHQTNSDERKRQLVKLLLPGVERYGLFSFNSPRSTGSTARSPSAKKTLNR